MERVSTISIIEFSSHPHHWRRVSRRAHSIPLFPTPFLFHAIIGPHLTSQTHLSISFFLLPCSPLQLHIRWFHFFPTVGFRSALHPITPITHMRSTEHTSFHFGVEGEERRGFSTLPVRSVCKMAVGRANASVCGTDHNRTDQLPTKRRRARAKVKRKKSERAGEQDGSTSRLSDSPLLAPHTPRHARAEHESKTPSTKPFPLPSHRPYFSLSPFSTQASLRRATWTIRQTTGGDENNKKKERSNCEEGRTSVTVAHLLNDTFSQPQRNVNTTGNRLLSETTTIATHVTGRIATLRQGLGCC